jgi:CheY-like chemotaxis protein
MLGGEIRLDSEPGVGSVFTVYLPIGTFAQTRRGLSGGTSNGRSDGEPQPALQPVGVTAALGAGWRVEASQAVAERESAVAEKTLLVVEDDPFQRQHIIDLLASVGANTISVGTGEEALAQLQDQQVDCVVLDLGLPGVTGWQVIDYIRGHKALRTVPVVVYTAQDLTRKEELKLGRVTKTIVVKEVRSPERLKDEVTAILEGPDNASSPQSSSNGHEPDDSLLAGKKVLVVDDDIRNIFALTAMLERHGMEVISVDSGQEALDTLASHDDMDVALVDVMMPEMDGYQTMSRMRELSTFHERPIIALTAKAMIGDREKCIDAGASDYIAKPVNTPELMSMLKSWLAP